MVTTTRMGSTTGSKATKRIIRAIEMEMAPRLSSSAAGRVVVAEVVTCWNVSSWMQKIK
jgi:hypothetical protein